MAGINAPYGRSTPRPPTAGKGNLVASGPRTSSQPIWAKLSPGASVLAMFGYFLLLGSVAVVVITGQFPWFTLAPVTILLSIAYFRHVDEKEARRSVGDGSHG